jgi:hypothetical protein
MKVNLGILWKAIKTSPCESTETVRICKALIKSLKELKLSLCLKCNYREGCEEIDCPLYYGIKEILGKLDDIFEEEVLGDGES